MSQFTGSSNGGRQDRANGEGPRLAYFMDHPSLAGHFVLGSGNKTAEATAFLKNSSGANYVLDDDPDEEDRPLYQIDSNHVIL